MDGDKLDPKKYQELRDEWNFTDVRLKYDWTRPRPEFTSAKEEFERFDEENKEPGEKK